MTNLAQPQEETVYDYYHTNAFDSIKLDNGLEKVIFFRDTFRHFLYFAQGSEAWFNKNENLHNLDDLPALIDNIGSKYWFENGIRHRENGPAVEYYNGHKVWYYKGEHLEKVKTQQEFLKFKKLLILR